jgi:hypothetical protein
VISFSCAVSHTGLARSITREGQMEMTFAKQMFLTSGWNTETRYEINARLNYHL